ncbi:U2 snRNP complex subunit [Malassezia pachydermatis]|uniref:U2 small nuclear ribonucleoprotein A' n=1 Tax=Malassezia pachydermatis TaxID=77020 RepID=A0A0M9VN76_9BASI|nr:l domain-like protein [Malassezia pachydermatis]KOS13042.1 l domain-like protein [Malassezia pachydermatis]
MKLTAELLTQCESVINPLKERELDLRGLKIPAIENLGAARDVNDALDFTDNDVRYLGNFPRMERLRHLTMSNNLVSRIDPHIHKQLPYLQSLILTNNAVADYSQLSNLKRMRHLTYLSLMGNPIAREKHYREFIVWRLPHLRVLDFRRITERERTIARNLFETADGRLSELAISITGQSETAAAPAQPRSFEPGAPLTGASQRPLTESERAAIAEAIDKSQSMEEIRRLEEQLKLGYVPTSEA